MPAVPPEGREAAFPPPSRPRQITVVEASALLADPDAPQLLDCRQPSETAVATLPGALVIPLMEIPDRASGELDPARPVLVYCHHGVRSLNAAVMLGQLGFEAISMRGGTDAWSLQIDPTFPRY